MVKPDVWLYTHQIAGGGLRLSGFIVKPYTRISQRAVIVSVKGLETSFTPRMYSRSQEMEEISLPVLTADLLRASAEVLHDPVAPHPLVCPHWFLKNRRIHRC